MKQFFDWTIKAGSMFSLIFLFLYFTGQSDIGLWEAILVLVVCSVLLGVFFYLLEVKYFPIRKKQLMKKVIRIFDAHQISETQAKFKKGRYEIIVNIDFILRMSQYSQSGEVISFHVPRNQLGPMKLKRPLSQIEDKLNGKLTYRIYQTNGMGLKLAKKRIEKSLL